MKISIIGATGAVGREMIADLGLVLPGHAEVALFASPKSQGKALQYQDKSLRVQAFSQEALKGTDYVLMSAGSDFSKKEAKALVAQGITVIDNSSAWRLKDDVPLVVPQVNKEALKHHKGLIANPNCSTIQLVVALKPLLDQFGLSRVVVASYQSVSGSGQEGMNELGGQVQAHFRFEEPVLKVYDQPIAFNLIPAIGPIGVYGYCAEEEKMILETRVLLGLPELPVLPTTVRVPVFHCHSEAITVELAKEVSTQEVLKAWSGFKPLVVCEDTTLKAIPSPHSVRAKQEVFVSRLRLLYGQEKSKWIQFWNVADNLKRGAATNAVEILQCLLDKN